MANKVFAMSAGIRRLDIQSIEGLAVDGVWIKPLLYGDNGLLMEVHASSGITIPKHDHEHECYCYLVKGKVRAKIGDEVKELGPGDAFLHPRGVSHVNEIIEDALWVEVKIPPEETWLMPDQDGSS
jgi:quercetin dioxygenase-like cupin family protein